MTAKTETPLTDAIVCQTADDRPPFTISTQRMLLSHARRMERDRAELAAALSEMIDATSGHDRPWKLEGYGFDAKRAVEICKLGKRIKAE